MSVSPVLPFSSQDSIGAGGVAVVPQQCPLCGMEVVVAGQGAHTCPATQRPPVRAMEAASSRGDTADWTAKAEIVMLHAHGGRLEYYLHGEWKGAITRLEVTPSGSRAFLAVNEAQKWVPGILPKAPPSSSPSGDDEAGGSDVCSVRSSSSLGTSSSGSEVSSSASELMRVVPAEGSDAFIRQVARLCDLADVPHNLSGSVSPAERAREALISPAPTPVSLASTMPRVSPVLPLSLSVHSLHVGSQNDLTSPPPSAVPSPSAAGARKKKTGLSILFSNIKSTLSPKAKGSPKRRFPDEVVLAPAVFTAPPIAEVATAKDASKACSMKWTSTISVCLCKQKRLERLVNGEWVCATSSLTLGHSRKLHWKITPETSGTGRYAKEVDIIPDATGTEILNRLLKLCDKSYFETDLRNHLQPLNAPVPDVTILPVRTPVVADLMEGECLVGPSTLWPLPDSPGAMTEAERKAKKSAERKARKEARRERRRQRREGCEPTPVAPLEEPEEEAGAEDGPAVEPQNPCCVCLDKERNMVFFPCRHLCSCKGCSTKVVVCPMCRVKVTHRVEIWM